MSSVFDPITGIYNMRMYQNMLCHDGLSEFIKGGSLTKGTASNKNSYIDLVLFANGYRTFGECIPAIPGTLDMMKTIIWNIPNLAEFHEKTHHSVEVKVTSGLTKMKVDLLLTIGVLNPLVYRHVYQDMRTSTPSDRLYYSTALGPELYVDMRTSTPSDRLYYSTALGPELYVEFFKDAVSLGQPLLQNSIWRKNYVDAVTGGSLTKGSASNKNSYIDLVLFANGYRTYGECMPAIPGTLDMMKTFFWNIPNLADFHGKTRHTIEVKVTSGLTKMKVDIPLAIGVLNRLGSPRRVYQEMRTSTPIDRLYYSAALAPKLYIVTDAVSLGQPLLQTVIWRKKYFDDVTASHGRLSTSLFFELGTIHCWEEAGELTSFDLNVPALLSVVERLHRYTTLEIVLEKNYKKSECGQLTKRAPHVMDTANPTNDLMGRYNAWETVCKGA